jgi:two-component system KDP operon response regulator KdpE
MDELLARLRAALRRALPAAEEVSEVVTEAWTVDFVARRVTLAGGGAVRLTPVEWALVTPLLRNPDRLLTYRQLIDAVWGPTYDPDSNLLRVHMTHLRRKLEPEPARPRYLITESGMGYRFTPERER